MTHTPLRPVRFPERTLPATLVSVARRVPDRVFLRYFEPGKPSAPPREVTFAAFRDGVGRAAAFLRSVGVEAGARVLLLAENSPEWQFVALGTQVLRAEPATLFASLGAAPAEAIARRVRPRVVYVSGVKQWRKLAPAAADLAAEGLRAVVCDEPLPPDTVPADVRAVLLADVTGPSAPGLAPGELEALARGVGTEDPFLMIFTSGTTGRPKGVRVPQRALMHAIEGGNGAVGITEQDVGLHFLPFAHVAGHDQFFLALAQAHPLLMIQGRDDMERAFAQGPTYLFSVPLVYERIREAVVARLDALPAPLRGLVHRALAAAERVRVDGSRALADRALVPVADRLVGRAVRARLGGRVRAVYAGGAPATAGLFRFFEALGIPFVELYGMTETAGLISSNLLSGPRLPATAGYVTPDHEVRIAPDGELQVRGPLLLNGFLEPEDAQGAFTDDGFFRTGDLARLDADGLLHVEGRKKAVMVLSTGKKLSPEPIEQVIASEPPFLGATLLGEGRPFVSAAVFVSREALERLGAEAERVLLPGVRAALQAFSDYERPRRLIVLPGAPSDYPDLVTPTLKVKRDALLAYLGARIAALYGPATA